MYEPSWRRSCGTARARRVRQRFHVCVLEALDVVALEPPVDAVYGELRASLERIGRPMGANDLFIAAHALALGATLVTANEREFRRVERLFVENWLSDRDAVL